MGLTITINDINNLTDTERAVLRYITGDVRTTAVHTMPPIPDDELLTIPDFLRASHLHPEDYVPAPVAPVAPVAASAELDARGLPWDKRIHASTRTKVAAGTWKYARGVAADYIAQVERELRAVQAIPVPVTVTHGSPELDADAVKLEQLAGEGAAGLADVFAAPPAPTPVVPLPPAMVRELESTGHLAPLPPTAPAPMTFAQLMQHLTPMLVSGKLTQPMLQQVVGSLGLPHLAALGARPDLVETVRAAIDAEVCNEPA